MKRIKVVLSFFVAASLAQAQEFDLNNNWNLVGAVEDIATLQSFDKDCVVRLWSYDENGWKQYSKGDGELTSIAKGSGFWVNINNSSCQIDTSTVATDTTEFKLTSEDIQDGALMDVKFAHTYSEESGAQNLSPALSWSSGASGTMSYAIEMIDLDYQNSLHWGVINIPSTVLSLPQGVASDYEGMTSLESYGAVGYAGPFPPVGETHRYQITIYAVSKDSVSTLDEAKASSLGSAKITPSYLGK